MGSHSIKYQWNATFVNHHLFVLTCRMPGPLFKAEEDHSKPGPHWLHTTLICPPLTVKAFDVLYGIFFMGVMWWIRYGLGETHQN